MGISIIIMYLSPFMYFTQASHAQAHRTYIGKHKADTDITKKEMEIAFSVSLCELYAPYTYTIHMLMGLHSLFNMLKMVLFGYWLVKAKDKCVRQQFLELKLKHNHKHIFILFLTKHTHTHKYSQTDIYINAIKIEILNFEIALTHTIPDTLGFMPNVRITIEIFSLCD